MTASCLHAQKVQRHLPLVPHWLWYCAVSFPLQVSVSCTDCSDTDVESGVCRHTKTADESTTDTAVEGDNDDATVRTTSYKDAIGVFANKMGSTETVQDPMSASLLKMALITGAAVALHNFPEGLATFIASAKDPSIGAPIAIAIGVHNIPEGICVASPIYHATGSKWKAFMWGTLSGVAEPIAGAIGWIIFAKRDSDIGSLTYGILFGLVSGMMVFISFSELLTTALDYDKERKYFFVSLCAGMIVMAASLMLFLEA
eukprot:m.400670 g.400670  ORF g.400670 m.400670 type:complete len:258 (+) comp21163_c0_seq1:29-802(+)